MKYNTDWYKVYTIRKTFNVDNHKRMNIIYVFPFLKYCLLRFSFIYFSRLASSGIFHNFYFETNYDELIFEYLSEVTIILVFLDIN